MRARSASCRGKGLALLKRKFRLSGWMMLVAVAMITGYDSGGGSNSLSETSQLGSPQAKAAPTECPAGNMFTIENHNKYPIWLCEFAGDPAKIVVPPMGDWERHAGSTVALCTKPPFASGRFWSRPQCHFQHL